MLKKEEEFNTEEVMEEFDSGTTQEEPKFVPWNGVLFDTTMHIYQTSLAFKKSCNRQNRNIQFRIIEERYGLYTFATINYKQETITESSKCSNLPEMSIKTIGLMH
ncbi:jasmonic acid-amido synthetase JAR1-like [Senna tora]|uniref:Jasmonic acid-amido synthetase JAR1-like n=1 Tax=Senna tora TaxID=362788 RepID=A0A834U2G2_9FABA|nr:jasmonic acid-amido synthetase JAR1-like [Senna tora]